MTLTEFRHLSIAERQRWIYEHPVLPSLCFALLMGVLALAFGVAMLTPLRIVLLTSAGTVPFTFVALVIAFRNQARRARRPKV